MSMAMWVVAFVVPGSVLEGIPAIGLFGPLLGVGFYAACAIARVHPDKALKPMVGHMLR